LQADLEIEAKNVQGMLQAAIAGGTCELGVINKFQVDPVVHDLANPAAHVQRIHRVVIEPAKGSASAKAYHVLGFHAL